MSNRMSVEVKLEGNRIEYQYEVSGEWREAFNIDGISGWYAWASNGIYDFFIEYDFPTETVPKSIAVIPFLCNVLPIAWLYDAEIEVDELDEDFYHSIDQFKKGYIDMYPTLEFKGTVKVQKLVKNRIPLWKRVFRKHHAIVFYSGGVDANFTLLSKLNEKPVVATLWGSDLYFREVEEWNKVSSQNKETSENFNLSYSPIKTSFRLFINYDVLNEKFIGISGASNWWHGFQHGIGIISHAAPLAWYMGIDRVYISSSYSTQDGDIKCASYPTIDPYVKFFGATVIHYDFQYTRQDKVEYICKVSRENGYRLKLRVCWEAAKGENCCACEKCIRTFFAVLAENGNPRDYGFEADFSQVEKVLLDGKVKPSIFWKEIIDKLKKLDEKPKVVLTLIDLYHKAG